MKGKYELVETSFQSPSGSERNRGFFLGSFWVLFLCLLLEEKTKKMKIFANIFIFSFSPLVKGTKKNPKRTHDFVRNHSGTEMKSQPSQMLLPAIVRWETKACLGKW